jgi:1,4-alpha-glucan branching enzyme
MAKKKSEQKTKRRRVTFSLEAPEAGQVKLMGDFNGWHARAHPMNKDENGLWKKTVMLTPGRHEYKFLVDGRWQNDPQNDHVCINSFGTQNSVLIVPRSR